MQRPSRVVLVVCVFGVVACAALFLFVGSRMSRKTAVPPKAASTASSTGAGVIEKKAKLQFTFKDVAIAPLADEREQTYTFYIRNQFIGIREMQPNGADAQKSFSAWLDGLHGTIRFGGQTISVQRQTIAGRDAIAFETTDGDVRAANIITEVRGHVLLLQSQTTQGVLEEFLQKIDTVTQGN